MNHKFFFIIAIFLVTVSCESKKQFKSKPLSLDRSYEIYSQAVTRMESGDWFYAHKKFAQAELLMQDIDHAAQSLLMSSYCLYQINFYPEAQASLENLQWLSPYKKRQDEFTTRK